MRSDSRPAGPATAEDEQKAAERGGHGPKRAEDGLTGGRRGAAHLAQPDSQHHHGQQARYGAEQGDALEGRPVERQGVALGQPHHQQRQPQTDHRAQAITGAVEAKGRAAPLGRHTVGQQGVARSGAHPLAEAVAEAHDQHSRPTAGECEQRLGQRGKGVAGHRRRLAADDAI
jgi:hypothetical protein